MPWILRNGTHHLVGTPFTIEQTEPDDVTVYRGTKPAFAADSLSAAKAAAERMWAAEQPSQQRRA